MTADERGAETLIVADILPVPAGEEGNNSSVEGRDEPRDLGLAETNPLGDGRDGAQGVGDLDVGEIPVRVDDILERFRRETRLRFREGSATPRVYVETFRRFARAADLEHVSRQALAGKKGRVLLLDHMARVPERSRRVAFAALRCVWTTGIGLPFPLDMRSDFGKSLPPVGRRKTPPDETVRPWAEAVAREKDPYTRALVLCELQFGWRPENQLGHLHWRHIRYADGRMHHVEADGAEARFKSPSPVVARLPEDVRQALEEWRAQSPAATEDDYIFPRRVRGTVRRGALQDEKRLLKLWRAFATKHDLPELRPVDCRHWVKTALRRIGLSDPAMAAWQGHKATEGGMRAVYDNPELEALLDEQAVSVPRGPLALLAPPEVRAEAALPPEAARIVAELPAGTISDLEAVGALGRLRPQLARKVSPLLEP